MADERKLNEQPSINKDYYYYYYYYYYNYSIEEATFEAVCTTQGWYHKNNKIKRVTTGASTIREKKIVKINIIITV